MLFKKLTCACISVVAALTLTACHQRVEPVSGMEKQMTCAELQNEMNDTQKVKETIASNRGVSLRNAVGLLFWPSILINEVTGESASQQASSRLVELRNIYAAKQCSQLQCAGAESLTG